MNEVTVGIAEAPSAQNVPATAIAIAAPGPRRAARSLARRFGALPPLGRAAICTALAVAMVGATIGALMLAALLRLRVDAAVGTVGLLSSTVLAVIGCGYAALAIWRESMTPGSAGSALAGLLLLGVNSFMAFWGALLTLWATAGFARGRQIRRRGRVLLPDLRPGRSWAANDLAPIDVDPPSRKAVAMQWRENAKTEHASVAAFARLTLDLMGLGAPADLLAAAQRDALDEIRHAQICLSLASAIDAQPHEPAPFSDVHPPARLWRPRILALAELAAHSLVDGALHEGFSARIVARLARVAGPKPIRDALAVIASDEGRHSAHGWRVVDWCVRQGGEPVLRAVEGAARALPRKVGAALPAAAEDGSWQRWGIHGRALQDEEYSETRSYVVRRVVVMRERYVKVPAPFEVAS